MTIRWNHAGLVWLIVEIVCNILTSEVYAFPISFLSHHRTAVRFSTSFPKGTSPSSTVGPLYLYNKDNDKKNKDNNYGNNNDKDGMKEGNSDLIRELENTYQYEGRLSAGGKDHRCGYVCLVGAPNMGKSTLMNALLETDLSVATSRPQTTRHAILGLMTSPNRQVCLLDTPGVLDEPAYRLQEGMMEAVMGAFHDADCLLIVTDVFSTPISKDALFRKVQTSTKPIIVVINKVDLFDGASSNRNNGGVNNTLSTSYELNDGRTHSVQDAVARWRSWLPQALLILPLSALSSKTKKDVNMNTLEVSILRKVLMGESNIPEALRDLGRPIPGMFPSDLRTISDEIARNLLPLGPPLYESDALTDRSERFFASELIRSALFENLRKELPYCCEVRVTKFQEPPIHEKEDNDGKVKTNLIRIQADVIVERDSQKGIVVGKRGTTIRTISIDARAKLEHFFQSPVYLELQVKVENEWRKNEDTLKKFGYLR